MRKRHSFLSAFPMFVPSLSWQNDRFQYKLLKNGVWAHEILVVKASAATPA
jgi:hypothetical protein